MKKAHLGEGAFLGAALGITLAGIVSNKKNNVIISALAGALIGSTIGAHLKTKPFKVPYIVEDAGALYKVYPDGSRKKIRV